MATRNATASSFTDWRGMHISVIVSTFNSPATLERVLWG